MVQENKKSGKKKWTWASEDMQFSALIITFRTIPFLEIIRCTYLWSLEFNHLVWKASETNTYCTDCNMFFPPWYSNTSFYTISWTKIGGSLYDQIFYIKKKAVERWSNILQTIFCLYSEWNNYLAFHLELESVSLKTLN